METSVPETHVILIRVFFAFVLYGVLSWNNMGKSVVVVLALSEATIPDRQMGWNFLSAKHFTLQRVL